MVHQRRSLPALLLLALLGALPVRAADSWPVPRGPSHEPAPYRFDRGQVSKLPREFREDAAACVLYAGTSHTVEADGTVETVTHEVTRLNSRKGIDRLGEYRNILYDPAFEKLTLNEARVHKADGRRLDVEPRHVHLRDIGTDYQVYDRDKQLVISFPTLEAGDTIEVKWTVRGKNPEHGGRFFTRYSFGDVQYPVALDELRVRLPKDRPLRFATVGAKLDPVCTEEAGHRTYHWQARNRPQPPQGENLPSPEELRPCVACSTFASWEEVAAWKRRLRADCWKCTDEVRRVVREATRGLTDPKAKARALTYWVKRNVRYVSRGDKHDYTPHPPARVLANRYGDCKDTTQLLAVLLREAGVPAALATLGSLDDGQVLEDVPCPWGTHALLLVTLDGTDHWIDTTATLAAWDFLPREDRDRLCYVVDEAGRLRLKRTPPLTADDNRYEQSTEVWVGADGSSRCERVVVAHGSAAVAQRDNFVEVPRGERRRLVAAELVDSNSRSRLVRLAVEEKSLRDYDRPVTARMAFEIPNHFSGGPEREGSLSDSKVWGKLLAYPLDYERKVALVFNAPFASHHRYVVHLPPAYHLESLPQEHTVRSRWGEFRVRVKALGDQELVRHLELDFHTRLERPRVEPADFDAFRKFQEEVSREYRAWLTLKPVRDREEAPLLEAVLFWAPQDSASAEVLARLYEENEMPAEARRVLRRARHYRPENAVLWELSAKVAGTREEEEAARRELVRLFPDEPHYALALAATLIGEGKQEPARKLLLPLTRTGLPASRALAHFQLARSYYRRDELKSALHHLEEAARADPESIQTVQAYLLKGRIHEEMGRSEEAIRAYEQALDVDRQAVEALNSLVRLELAADHRPRALDYLRRYSLAVGNDLTGLLRAADYYLRLGRDDDAFELASRSREVGFHEKAQRILGLVSLRRGDAARALHHLEKAELDAVVLDGLISARLLLGTLGELPAQVEQAEKSDLPSDALLRACLRGRRLLLLRKQLEKTCPPVQGKESDWPAALDALACAEQAHAEGRPAAQVEALLDRALAGERQLGPAVALRGLLALEHGKLTRALADAERAVALSPDEPGGYLVRGRVRLERNGAGALADLERAAALSRRRDAAVLHALAEALFRAGRVREALSAEREAVKLKPDDRELSEQLKTYEKALPSP